MQLVGALFSHFAKFALGRAKFALVSTNLCQTLPNLCFFSEKGVFNRCDCVPTSSFFMLLGYSIATGRYSIFSKMILTSKKHLGEIALGAFNTITDRN